MSQEIIEVGVTSIEMASTALSTRVYKVEGGRCKWFIDELGQKWVKFQTGDGITRTDRVCPADLVVEVCYVKN